MPAMQAGARISLSSGRNSVLQAAHSPLAQVAIARYHSEVGQLLVRNVPEKVIAALKKRAKKHGRSAEAEHRTILQQALKPPADDFWKEADRIRAELQEAGHRFTDSTEFIRQDRDRR